MKVWDESKFFGISNLVYIENQQNFLSMLPKNMNGGGVLLDVGCGDGSFTVKIAEAIKAREVHGAEIDQSSADLAIQRGIKVKVCNLNKQFPFEDNIFDIITANQSIEHLYDHDNFFKEIRRVLKKNGIFIISTLNLCAWHNILFTIFGMQPPGMHLCEVQVGNFLYGTQTHGHIKLFSPRALRDSALYYGFKISSIKGSGYYPFTGYIADFLSKLDKTHSVYITVSGYKNENIARY